MSPDGKYVYALEADSNEMQFIVHYKIGSDGALSPKSTPAVVTGGGGQAGTSRQICRGSRERI